MSREPAEIVREAGEWQVQSSVVGWLRSSVPRILLCLGKDTLKSVLGCFDSTVSNKVSYNCVIESEKNPVVVSLSDGVPVYVFALAHCGVMGTLNRNRGSGINSR